MSARFYVYLLSEQNGKPFYVGKGSGKRMDAHEKNARLGLQTPVCNKIRKIWSQGFVINKTVLFETNEESEAFSKEIEFIAKFGRKNLCNATDGGEGQTGCASYRKGKKIPSHWKTGSIEATLKANNSRKLNPNCPKGETHHAAVKIIDGKTVYGTKKLASAALGISCKMIDKMVLEGKLKRDPSDKIKTGSAVNYVPIGQAKKKPRRIFNDC